ncbi:MAG: hypothetical protein GF307_09350 [candidate division Zixibacteria bacterium]|nr:hypothetical protein [candidate division Zixibacteria bacterium]
MFNKIMVPTDLSNRSLEALKYAVDLANKYNAKITLLHVVERFLNKEEMVMLRVSASDFEEMQKQMALSAKEIMEDALKRIGAPDVEHKLLLREGSKPHRVIMKTAQEEGMDLIVITTNGRTGLDEDLLGSNAERIVRHCRVPVLTIRVDEED